MVVLPHLHQDTASTVLDVLSPLNVLAGDPDEECIAVVEPGGDKGVDKSFHVRESDCGAKFGNVPKKEVLQICLMWASKVR